ncbi:S24 family peptidase [Helicobacter sp. MIT 21-1697]|uniref:S24 family peptidase n=1 Tax=Helicobacter sp. MIT 21-1697 TaxID=2993733 RepID=UPI00224A71FE|nr:S24 family peptidase [Helicobacter sp. MIT 21-1697]MCX2717827.1 S24 family peptidase [Helicobacter sp. MIT 21-1697]
MKLTCKESIERIKDILATDSIPKPKDIDVARALKIHPNTLAQAKFQDRIPYKAIMDFLQSKNISINTFFYGAEAKQIAQATKKYKILRLYKANASAGGGCINEHIPYTEVLFDTEILHFLHIQSCEMIIALGDSMETIMSDRSLCFISRNEQNIKDGKIYAIRTLEGLFIKHCFICGQSIKLISANPAYAPMSYALNEIEVIGRIRGIISSFTS